MIIINIILGLIGLGIVILVHEFGHFISAKIFGITVEVFSIGWGKKLATIKRGDTEYCISMLPIGGYCKLKGEEILKKAVEEDRDRAEKEEGSLFSVPPWKRIVTYLSGPLANLLFSIVVLSVVWFAGFDVQTFENRIVLQSETILADRDDYPADIAGMQTGDRIIEINGSEIEYFKDIEIFIAPSPGTQLDVTVLRNGAQVALQVTPVLDSENDTGIIGVAAWIDPIIAAVKPDSASEAAGLTAGDRIKTINEIQINNSMDLYSVLLDHPETLEIAYARKGISHTASVPVYYDESNTPDIEFSFEIVSFTSRAKNPFVAIAKGTNETIETLVLSLKSIGMLFKGVNVGNAVSGPIRITYFIGEVAARGFGQGFRDGLIIAFRFLSLLCVAIFFMNLLPIPALDGGMILISIVEIILRRPVRPKIFYRYQFIGFMFILAILVLATFNDVFYLIRN
jgi:regulator of sigma E protease